MTTREEYDFSEPESYAYKDKIFDNSGIYGTLNKELNLYSTYLYPNKLINLTKDELLEMKACETRLFNILDVTPNAKEYLLARKNTYLEQLRNPEAVDQRFGTDTIMADIMATENCISIYHEFNKGK